MIAHACAHACNHANIQTHIHMQLIKKIWLIVYILDDYVQKSSFPKTDQILLKYSYIFKRDIELPVQAAV